MFKVISIFSTFLVALALSSRLVFADSTSVPFMSQGNGTETTLSPLGCQFTIGGCIVQSVGVGTSEHMGADSYTSDLTVVWSQASSNGQGGYCAPATGTSVITAANGDQLDLSNSGTVCEVGSTGYNIPHSFQGTYTITGGTGRFIGASGTGQETGGDDGYGNSYYNLSGSISY